jgi:hypothetical protein
MVCTAGQANTLFPFKLMAVGFLFYAFLSYSVCEMDYIHKEMGVVCKLQTPPVQQVQTKSLTAVL